MFVEHCRYLFEALGPDNRPVSRVSSVDEFKAAIGIFFRSVLDTGYYLPAIPPPQQSMDIVNGRRNKCDERAAALPERAN